MSALRQGNEVRLVKAGLKRRLKTMDPGEACLFVAKYLEADAISLHRFKVHELLTSIPEIGGWRASKIAQMAGCHPAARFGSGRSGDKLLPAHRRLLLAQVLRQRSDEARVRKSLYGDVA
jgi:hypothetical protein